MSLNEIAQLLGNFGEFIASIAVLATLIYLSLQIRQNTQAIQRTEMREAIEQYDRWRSAIQNSETADLWLRGLDDNLSGRSEGLRFNSLFAQHTYAMHSTWDCVSRGIMEPEEWNRPAPYFASLFQTPGGRKFWKRNREHHDPEFVRAIESYFQ